MSQWGNFSNLNLKGTVTTSTTSDLVTGFSTEFNSNVKQGDYVVIASNKYQIYNVVSNTQIYLSNVAATSSDNVKAFLQQGPKDLSNVTTYNGRAGRQSNVYNIQNVYGVDRQEIDIPENRDRGVNHTGWLHYTTYTTGQGCVRHKSEMLVAMSKNFDSSAAGTLFGQSGSNDAADDTVLANAYVYFEAQPSNVTDYLANLSAATFSVTANYSPYGSGVVLSYQWQRAANTVDAAAGYWTNVQNATVYSDNTSATLNISNTSGLNGNVFRVVLSGTQGADDNNSNQATITIL